MMLLVYHQMRRLIGSDLQVEVVIKGKFWLVIVLETKEFEFIKQQTTAYVIECKKRD